MLGAHADGAPVRAVLRKPKTIVATALLVVAPAPTASFITLVASGTAPLVVAMTDTSTDIPTSWAWDLGDRTTSTLKNPSVTYAAASTYTVTLIDTNATGTSAPVTQTIVSYPPVTIPPTTPPTTPATGTPASRLSDFNRDGITDLVARDNAGKLWLYPGNGTGRFLTRKLMGTGWKGLTAIVPPGDITGDGNADVLARTSAGALMLYPGNGAGRFSTFRVIGARGWNAMTTTTAAGLMSGDARPDVTARDSAGRLWLHPTTSNGRFLPRRLIGRSGWNVMTAIMGAGNLSGDAKADLLARDKAGKLWLYRGNGTGGFATRTPAGTGWGGMTALVTPGNWNRTGGNDLIARDRAGTL